MVTRSSLRCREHRQADQRELDDCTQLSQPLYCFDKGTGILDRGRWVNAVTKVRNVPALYRNFFQHLQRSRPDLLTIRQEYRRVEIPLNGEFFRQLPDC